MEPTNPHYCLLPNGTAVIAVDDMNRQILSVGWKETYHIEESGRCELQEKQEPFDFDVSDDIDGPSAEPEFVPYKLATDLVIFGNAWAPNGKLVSRMSAALQVNDIRKEIAIIGNRTCSYRKGLTPLFTEPEEFEYLPITYKLAYGGVAPIEVPPPKSLMDIISPYPGVYPRNDLGKGYVIFNDPDQVEGLELPNIEDPNDLLTPERIIVGSPEKWWRQPLPQSFEWISPGWYPRIVHFGCVPDGLPDDDSEVPEVKLGYLPHNHKKFCEEASLEETLLFSFTNGASPGLSLPYLKGDEEVILEGMRPQGLWNVTLPGRIPEVIIHARGETNKLSAILQTVLIETEIAKLTLVWRAHWYPSIDLPSKLPTISNPNVDPLEGIGILVNGGKLH